MKYAIITLISIILLLTINAYGGGAVEDLKVKALRYTCTLGHRHVDFLEEDFNKLMKRIEEECR
jgi:hypothetical protein